MVWKLLETFVMRVNEWMKYSMESPGVKYSNGEGSIQATTTTILLKFEIFRIKHYISFIYS